MQILFFNRSLERELLLKATTTKTVTVPAYTRKDGTVVPAHAKVVHYDPAKSMNDVLEGNGSHSQKKAHAKLSKLPHWHTLHPDDQHAHILSSATNIQNAASFSSALSTWKGAMLAGKKPSQAQMHAYGSLVANEPEKAGKLMKEVIAAIGEAKALELMGGKPAPEPAAAPAAALAPQPEVDPHTIPGVEGWHASLAAGKVPTVAQHEAVKKDGFGKHYDQAVEKHGHGITPLVNQSTDQWFNDKTPYPGKPQPAASKQADSEAAVAQAKIKEIIDGHGGHYPTLAFKKLSGDGKWQMAGPVEQLSMIVTLAKELQAAATASSAVSLWKKNALDGKNPTDGQWKAFYDLPQEKKAKLLDEVKAKHGGWDHLKAPNLPLSQEELEKKAGKQEPRIVLPKKPSAHVLADDIKGALDTLASQGDLHNLKEIAKLNTESPNGNKAIAAYASQKVAELSGPKDGDTKQGADGTLVFKDGRWHKYVDADEHGEVPPVLVPVDNETAPAAPQPAVAGPWQVKTFPHTTKGHTVYAVPKPGNLCDDEYKTVAAVAKQQGGYWSGYSKGGAIPGFLFKDEASASMFASMMNQAGHGQVAPAAPTQKKTVTQVTYHNTSDGHNKFWSVYVSGSQMVTTYGKMGSKGSKTVKTFGSEHEAMAEAVKLTKEKKAKGYYLHHEGNIEVDAPAAALAAAPKAPEPSTQQWAFDPANPGMSGAPTLTMETPDGMVYVAYSQEDSNFEVGRINDNDPDGLPDYQHFSDAAEVLAHLATFLSAGDLPGAADLSKLTGKAPDPVVVLPKKAEKVPAVVKKLQAIDPAEVAAWMAGNESPGFPGADAKFWHQITKPTHTKFIKWNQAAGKFGTPEHWQNLFRGAAVASLFGMHDQVLLNDGTWKPAKSVTLTQTVDVVTDPAKIKEAAIAAKLGKPAPAAGKPAPIKFLNATYTKEGENWKSAAGAIAGPGGWLHTALSVLNGDPISQAVTDKAKEQAAEVLGSNGAMKTESALNAIFPPSDSGPHEGDTKFIGGVTYVLKNGRWHKQASAALTNAELVPFSAAVNQTGKTKMAATNAAALAGDIQAVQDLVNKYSVNTANSSYKHAVATLKKMQDKLGGAAPAAAKPAPEQPKAQPSAGPTIFIKKAKNPGATVMDGWVQTGKQQGSNPGGRFKDKAGKEWYCKFPADPDVVKNEFLAAKFYQMLGVAVPTLKLVEKDGKLGIASKWQDGLTKGSADQLSKAQGAHEAFAIDAWLGNWDVVGLSNDNLLLDKDGKAVRVDVGGSLVYRAQGGKKGDAFGNKVQELDSLKDANTNAQSAAVFGGAPKEAVAWGVRRLNLLKPSQIEELVEKAGPGTAAEKKALAAKLIARRADILKKFGIQDQWDKPAPDLTKLTVNPADLPKKLDFVNWSGPGKGLSSKAWLNEQNTKDSEALIAFASHGNLQALKDYHYDAVDKESGQVVGKKPITDHPSKHVKEQWAGLVELLQSIAFPPAKSLNMPPLGSASSFEEVSEVSGFFHPVDRPETVTAEHRMGFFMKLGQVDNIHELIAGMNFSFLTPQSPWVKSAFAGFKGLSSAVRAYIAEVQASGWINHIWSQGKATVSANGYSGSYNGGVQALASKVYKEALEIPEGTVLYRGMTDKTAGKSMMQQFLEAKPGLVIQNTDSMCTSYNEHHSWGGDIQMKIRCAKGAKGTPSFASGHFGSEHEITTLPGQRFVVLDVQKKGHSSIFVDVLMLPPHEGYVDELKGLESLGKSIVLLHRKVS